MIFIYDNIELIVIMLLGMSTGSFITMASYRLSLKDKKFFDLLLQPSKCPKCSNNLRALNLVPIFSWLFQRGKCSFCKSKIPVRYFLIEIINLVSFVLIYFALNKKIDAQLILILLIFLSLFLMIITDLENYFISDFNQIFCAILIIIYHFLVTSKQVEGNDFLYYLFSALFYLAFGLILHYIFKLVTKKDGIGVDDIKFFAVAGLALGIDKFAIFLFLSGFIGIIFGAIWQKLKNDYSFPFAPALIAAFIISFTINFEEWQLFY